MKSIRSFVFCLIIVALAIPSFGLAQEPTEVTFFFHAGQGGEADAIAQITENLVVVKR